MRRRRYPPVTPPVIIDDEKRSQLAAVIMFGFTPTDRALAGWNPGSMWLAVELQDLGVLNAEGSRVTR